MTKRNETQATEPVARANGPAEETVGANGAAEAAAPEASAAVELAAVIAERDEYLDRLQRSVAEFANFRRRVEQERAQVREGANRALLTQVVPVLDDLQRALASVPEEQRDSAWVQGVQHIERKLAAVLERAGVEPIEALGQPFDPALHEAVATEPGSAGTTVTEVYQTGYKLGNTLLRPAMVKVGNGTSG